MERMIRTDVNFMWYTTGMANLTAIRLSRLAVVPYAVVEWLIKKGRTPN